MEFVPAIVACALVAFAVVSRRLGTSWITGTMVFTAIGLVLGPQALDLVDPEGPVASFEVLSVLLTGTLVIVLFTDASAVSSSSWRDDIIPARLLGIGLPLAIVFGWLVALVLLGDLELWEAAVLGTMLAPTDAALGKAVVCNPRVPARVRQALNIESGLNDGIALPIFIVFLETARATEASLPVADIITELVQQVGIALVVGVAVGWIGAQLITWGRTSGAAIGYWLQISIVLLAVLAYTLTTPLGGSGFIAAWVAGYFFGRFHDSTDDESLPEYAEATGDLLTIASFLVFGVFLGPVLADLTWEIVAYGVLSLTVVRMTAVACSLLGSGMRSRSVLYIGWFGPRGLATIILTLEVVDESHLIGGSTIADAALFTVALSVLAHGLTAWWGSNAYAGYIATHPDAASLAEHDPPALDVRVPLRSRHHASSVDH